LSAKRWAQILISGFELKNLVDRNRQMAELVDVGAFLTGVRRP
jgi:hypothetical protein